MSAEFRPTAPSAETVFYRSYSRRKADGSRESFKEAMNRAIDGIAEVGKLNKKETELIRKQALAQHAFPSGRAFWVAGSDWSRDPSNFYGYYNCSSVHIQDLKAFGLLMDMAMQGTGTGAVLEQETIAKLPVVRNRIKILKVISLGEKGGEAATSVIDKGDHCILRVGDSRQGWVDAYQGMINSAFSEEQFEEDTIRVVLDLSQVRPAGERLKGFGGTANPIKLEEMFRKVAALLSNCYGRKLTSVEACLLIDEAAACVVAGNIRRSAGMRQGSSTDQQFIHAKEGLYTQDEEGNWKVDPAKEALRMANHTVCYHTKPTLEEVRASVQKQFYSGEGAIQYVPEAIARANVDLLLSPAAKDKFIYIYENHGKQAAKQYLQLQAQLQNQELDERELEHRITRYGLNPCLTPETQVMTRSGYAQIKDLVGKAVEIYDGQEWRTIDNFRVTGYDQDVYDVELHDGSIITATAYHTFILEDGTRKELRELEIGDTLKIANIPAVSGTVAAKGGYLKGFLIGDGTSDKGQGAICKVYAPKAMCVERLVRAQEEIGTGPHKKEPGLTPAGYLRNLGVMSEDMNPWCHRHKQEFPYETLNWTTVAKAEFLAGLFDADGTAMDTKNGYAYQITSISRPFLEGLLTLLRTLGIYGKIGPARDREYQDFGPERGGVCKVKPAYRVTIAQAASVKLAQLCNFERLKSFADRMPKYNIHPKNNRVKSVKFSHTAPEVYCCTVEGSHAFTLANQIVIGQCAEVVMRDNLCNLAEVHLNTIDPKDTKAQYDAFYAAGIQVAALLKHKFIHERIQYSREIDPIVGVSFTGLFDFFVTAFGANWLEWMFNDRPDGAIYCFEEREQQYLEAWKQAAYDGVKYYCDKHKIRMPNRWTVVQPAGSKSLLTGASSGWHPPYAQRFIRRITLGVQDPLVSALRDWGYSLVPAPSARDDEGNLLNDINDPRVREVLVEIPTEVSWANMPGVDMYDLNQISAVAQMRLYMNVQRHYATHTTSATISFRENEIDSLAQEIHNAIGTGYIGVALLARFDANATFPRLPFEPITKEKYDELMRGVQAWRLPEDEELGFLGVLDKYDRADYELTTEAACTSAACIARVEKDEQEGKAS